MMPGQSNSPTDPGGLLILSDQVIFFCIHILPMRCKRRTSLDIYHFFPVCRYNDCTHIVGLQSL